LTKEKILSRIVSEIKDSKYFLIMMDETTDISRHEQVSLVLQYTDDQFHVYERFIGFERASSTTGDDLFNLLVEWLKQLGLHINNIVAQFTLTLATKFFVENNFHLATYKNE
jgi:hypothetical protein